MAQTIRVSLPGYNALTDTNSDHFALNADEDDVLIKEKLRGTIYVPPTPATSIIKHGLKYIPLVFVFAEISAGKWVLVLADSGDYNVSIRLNTSQLTLVNGTGATIRFKYYIFYDQQV